MKELAHNTIRQVWGWFTDLGLFMSGLMGFYAIFRIVKYGIGVILNGIQLYQTLECGVMILASLWNNLTMWVTHRHHQKVGKAKTDPVVDQPTQLNEVTTQRIYPNLSHWTEQQDSEGAKDIFSGKGEK
ncbi:hypothetical protein JTB14_028218 [Gonioctena quinquepunctata]|nr:hypothetical protein JTB14_028218 [Gonioctena quinquepunctata]